jgi:hypothetical protein
MNKAILILKSIGLLDEICQSWKDILSCFWAFTKNFSIWLAHTLGSGMDSKNNKNA